MATDSRQRTTWGSRFRFLTRALGLTGLLVVVVGAIMLYADLAPAARDFGGARAAGNQARAGGASMYLAAAVLLILGGLAAIAVALAVEALNLLLSATGRSTSSGSRSAAELIPSRSTCPSRRSGMPSTAPPADRPPTWSPWPRNRWRRLLERLPPGTPEGRLKGSSSTRSTPRPSRMR